MTKSFLSVLMLCVGLALSGCDDDDDVGDRLEDAGDEIEDAVDEIDG